MLRNQKQWDVFISHASEDKDGFVRPLAAALSRLGLEVWYADFSLRPGESLSRSIDRGLAESRFGLVVISRDFIRKPWPEYEFRGLVSREIDEGRVILPIWHRVTRAEVLTFSPPLADKWALITENTKAEDVAIQILREVRPDLYQKHPRAELERLATGEALKDLQREIDQAKQELSSFKCPFCAAPLVERGGEFAGPTADHYGLHEVFECGYHAFDVYTERPCPSDPRFPRYQDYEIQYFHNPTETHFGWQCYARPQTDMARRVSLQIGVGRTKEDAEQRVRERYERYAAKHQDVSEQIIMPI